jgi:hypothetical protein
VDGVSLNLWTTTSFFGGCFEFDDLADGDAIYVETVL